MEKEFQEVRDRFLQLKRKFLKGKITNQEFKAQLKKLRLNDKKGRCWTIGARTGKWYYFDGRNWVESKAPTLQEGKAICIYCGFENDLANTTCDYCGGNMGAGDYSCAKCGFKLNSPTQDCPKCDSYRAGDLEEEYRSDGNYANIDTETEVQSPQLDEEEITPHRKKEQKVSTLDKFTELDSKIEDEETALADDGGPNYVFRSVSSNSLFLFLAIAGSIVGIIFGVLTGASVFFPELITRLPDFLQSLQGKLLGGIVYGILGGFAAFMLFGIFGYVSAVLINIILSFFGGIKIRMDKH